MQSTKEKVGIGHGQRSSFAITSRPGMSTSRFRTNVEYLVSIGQDGPSSSRNGVDI